MKYAVSNPEEVSWFRNRYNDGAWSDETRCVMEALRKLEDAGQLEAFLEDNSSRNEEGGFSTVDMDEIWEVLRYEPDETLAAYGLDEGETV